LAEGSPAVSLASRQELEVGIDGDVATLTLKCQTAANAITEGLVRQLSAAMAEAASDLSIKAICLCGQPDVFSSGVDVDLFVRCLAVGDLDRILRFTRATHALLAEIEASRKPVVAWVRGAAFGGGLELALACHRIFASPRARFAFPETGLGIYPGAGGTQRTPRRIGMGLAKWMIYTGAVVPAPRALEIGLVDAVGEARAACETLQILADYGVRKRIGPKFQILDKLFLNNSLEALTGPSFPSPSDPQAVRAILQLRGKAPLALRLAEHLIDGSSTMPLCDAIDEEFAHLREILCTEDARAGLASLGKERPTFAGR
jgi:enoyl-CoA hydratase/3-hydroxyacyl-CoA dehydrogenase